MAPPLQLFCIPAEICSGIALSVTAIRESQTRGRKNTQLAMAFSLWRVSAKSVLQKQFCGVLLVLRSLCVLTLWLNEPFLKTKAWVSVIQNPNCMKIKGPRVRICCFRRRHSRYLQMPPPRGITVTVVKDERRSLGRLALYGKFINVNLNVIIWHPRSLVVSCFTDRYRYGITSIPLLHCLIRQRLLCLCWKSTPHRHADAASGVLAGQKLAACFSRARDSGRLSAILCSR